MSLLTREHPLVKRLKTGKTKRERFPGNREKRHPLGGQMGGTHKPERKGDRLFEFKFQRNAKCPFFRRLERDIDESANRSHDSHIGAHRILSPIASFYAVSSNECRLVLVVHLPSTGKAYAECPASSSPSLNTQPQYRVNYYRVLTFLSKIFSSQVGLKMVFGHRAAETGKEAMPQRC